MSPALVLVILVSTSELRKSATVALKQAAEEVLGVPSRVTIRGFSEPLGDAQISGAAGNADAVAEVLWHDDERESVTIHVYIKRTQHFVDRNIAFSAADDPLERGRMIGFAVASLLPEALPGGGEPPPPEKPPDTPARGPNGPHWIGAADVTAVASSGVGSGEASGFGAGIAAHWLVLPTLSLRLGGAIRFGNLAAAQASTSLFVGAAGVGWRFWTNGPEARFSLGTRTDLLVTQLSVSRLSSDSSAPVSHSRAIPGADLLLEGAWHWTGAAAFLASVGAEVAYGETSIVVQSRKVSEIPAFRLVGEAGMRVRF